MDRKSIEETKDGLLTDIQGKKNLLVTFGGIQQGIGIPVFEFFNSVKELDCDKVFIRDYHQAWYQKGIDDSITSSHQIENYLKELIEAQSYQKVCFLGNSMGGYAAMLFGMNLEVSVAIAFAPQTFINRRNRLWFRDSRWKKQMADIYKNEHKHSAYFDLKKYFEPHHNKTTQIHLYFSPNHRLDAIHANRLSAIENVTLHAIDEGGHSVVKTVRDRGELTQLIKDAFYVDKG